MLPRTLEPEVMDTPDDARDYDAMDHAEVNRLFVDHLLEALAHSALAVALHERSEPLEILDVGTGTALIPIELCRRGMRCRVTAIDLAGEMLQLAARNVREAGLEARIRLERADSKRLPYPESSFDVVMSNSIVHHIAEPADVLAEMVRVVRMGGLLFVRDLLRPPDTATVERLVEAHAGRENGHQQQLFRQSLHAALTLDEVRQLLRDMSLPPDWAKQTSDRHWTIAGVLETGGTDPSTGLRGRSQS